MKAGDHPIVCLTCKEKLGHAFSVRWFSRADMDAETAASCVTMEKETNSIAVFFREHCFDCVKGDMPCLTGLTDTAC